MDFHDSDLLDPLQRLRVAFTQSPGAGVLVSVESSQGSVPRDAGAWMAVFPNVICNTLVGGHLEHEAIARARAMLNAPGGNAAPASPGELRRFALGPALGQCCGGVAWLRFEAIGPADWPRLEQRLEPARAPVALFGGGHVGSAIVRALMPLPFAVQWFDSRDEVFPAALPRWVCAEHSDPVEAAVADVHPGARVLVMSFSHAEDLNIVSACLLRLRKRDDLAFIGLIGSRSKWATFRHRLTERGFGEAELARVTCPIGLPGVRGKEPAVIAASVAAQLLLTGP